MSYDLLIVDDSTIIRKSLKKTLGMTPFEFSNIYEAENGEKAIASLERNKVDIVFLDINMPIMNGIEFMAAANEQKLLEGKHVVVLSTEGSEIRREQLKELGVQAQLRKPARPESVIEIISTIVEGE